MRSPWSAAARAHPTSAPLDRPPAPVPDRVAGYRAVRRLGSGRCADVFLGYSDRGDTVALKVFGPETPAERLQREVQALSAGRAGIVPGLPTLIDVTSLSGGGTCLVVERVEGESLARYLHQSSTLLLPGEAVTILGPILATLSGLHEVGFVHAELSLATVLVDLSGRPVLMGLGALEDLPGGAERVPMLRAEYARIERLVRGTLDGLDPGVPASQQAEHVLARYAAAAAASPFRPCLPHLEQVLFDWAAAVPLHPVVAPTTPPTPPTPAARADQAMPAVADTVLDGAPGTGRRAIRQAARSSTVTRRVARRMVAALEMMPARYLPGPERHNASRHPSW